MRLHIKGIDGIKDAERELERQGRTIADALADVVPVAAEAIRDEARRLVPVDTGRLRDEIGFTVDGTEAEVKIIDTTRASGTYYGQFVEFGTSKQPAQPFMGPAAEIERGRLRARVEDAVKGAADAN